MMLIKVSHVLPPSPASDVCPPVQLGLASQSLSSVSLCLHHYNKPELHLSYLFCFAS